MLRRRVFGVALALIMVLAMVISGCDSATKTQPSQPQTGGTSQTSSSSATTGSNEVTEIIYYTWSTEEDYMPQLIEAYEKSQDKIKVKFQTFPSANYEYYQKMLVLLSSKSEVDVFGVNSAPFYAMYYTRGILEPLNDYFKKDNIDVNKVYGEAIMYELDIDGKYFAMPHRKTAWVLYYNKDMLDEEGIPYPGQLTCQEFADLAYQLTKKNPDGSTRWGANIYSLTYSNYTWGLAQFGVTLASEQDISEELTKTFDILDYMYNEKPCAPSFADVHNLGGSGARAMFQNGECVFYPGGEWNIATFHREKEKGLMDINWDITFLPVFDGVATGTTCGAATSTGIPVYTNKKEAAWDFLKYMCTEEGASILASCGIYPAYNSEAVKNAFKSASPGINVDIMFDTVKVNNELPKHPTANEIVNETRKLVELYYFGEITRDQLISDMERVRREVMASYVPPTD